MNKVKEFINYLNHHDHLPTKYKEELFQLLDSQPESNVVELLVRGGFFESENLARLEAEFFNFLYVDLDKEKIEDVFDVLPFEIARDCGAVCFKQEGSSLDLALVFSEIKNIRKLNIWAADKGLYLNYFVCSLLSYEKILSQYDVKEELMETPPDPVVSADENKVGFDVVPIDKIVNTILTQMITVKAEELIIDTSLNKLQVRFRIEGVLMSVLSLPLTVKDHLYGFLKGLARVPLESTLGDGQFALVVSNQELKFSLACLKTNEGEKIIIKIVSPKKSQFDLETLGFSSYLKDLISLGLDKKQGKTIIFGESGSGRTTTLYSLLKQLDSSSNHIVTLENSIESDLPGISQLQMKEDQGLDYSSALKNLLRHQPDIIGLEEINNKKTAESVLHLAMTGANIITSGRGVDLADGLARLLRLKMDSYHLSSVLNTILAQRLVRRVCPHCGGIEEMTIKESDVVKQSLSGISNDQLPRGVDLSGRLFKMQSDGCSWCDYTGYLGKIAVAEGVSVDDKLRSDLSSVNNKREIKAALDKLDRLTMYQDGLIKVLQGRTTFEEIVSKWV